MIDDLPNPYQPMWVLPAAILVALMILVKTMQNMLH